MRWTHTAWLILFMLIEVESLGLLDCCKSGHKFDATSGCEKCDVGTYLYSSENCHFQKYCDTCLAGSYQGKQGQSTCEQCQPGTYQPKSGQSSCLDCPEGSFQPYQSKTDCNNCPEYGTCDTTSILSCDAGYYRKTLTSCDKCNLGYYKDKNDLSSCKQCPENSVCENTGFNCKQGFEFVNEQCKQCADGFYKSEIGNHACKECPIEATCTSYEVECGPDRVLLDGECIDCPQNANCTHLDIYCLEGFYRNGSSCLPCKTSTYQPNQGQFSCIHCPSNSECTSVEFQCIKGYTLREQECVRCPIGKFKNTAGNNECEECPKNSECDFLGFECTEGFKFDTASNSCIEVRVEKIGTSSASIIWQSFLVGVSCCIVIAILAIRRRSKSTTLNPSPSMADLIPSIGKLFSLEPKIPFEFSHEANVTTYAVFGEVSVPVFLLCKTTMEFEIGKKIARGGSSTIFSCTPYSKELQDRSQSKPLVFKQIDSSPDDMSQRRKNAFYQEISLSWKMSRFTGFVEIFGYSESPAGIILKHYKHGDLARLIYRPTNVYTKYCLINLALQIAKAVKILFSEGIVHSDIKPKNILLDVDTQGKLQIAITDFGISKLMTGNANLVYGFMTSDINGASVAYGAPEALRRMRGQLSQNNEGLLKLGDIYSVSITFFEMLNRKPPLPGQ